MERKKYHITQMLAGFGEIAVLVHLDGKTNLATEQTS